MTRALRGLCWTSVVLVALVVAYPLSLAPISAVYRAGWMPVSTWIWLTESPGLYSPVIRWAHTGEVGDPLRRLWWRWQLLWDDPSPC